MNEDNLRRDPFGNPATRAGLEQKGLDPESLSNDQKESLKEFENAVANKLRLILPSSYTVRSELNFSVTADLEIYLILPRGGCLQYSITPTAGDSAEDNGNGSTVSGEDDETERANNVAKTIAATSVHQLIQVDKNNETSQQGS